MDAPTIHMYMYMRKGNPCISGKHSHFSLQSHAKAKTVCIGENKDADQLRFRYSDSPVPLLLKSEI